MKRRATAGKARHREVETAPEEMNGTALANKACAEKFEDPIGLQKNLPKTARVFGIVLCVDPVFVEANRVWDLVWPCADFDVDPESGQRRHDGRVEICH